MTPSASTRPQRIDLGADLFQAGAYLRELLVRGGQPVARLVDAATIQRHQGGL
jgi:hypothetical protein